MFCLKITLHLIHRHIQHTMKSLKYDIFRAVMIGHQDNHLDILLLYWCKKKWHHQERVSTSSNEDNLINEDNLKIGNNIKNEVNPKNEDSLKNEDDLKNEDVLKKEDLDVKP